MNKKLFGIILVIYMCFVPTAFCSQTDPQNLLIYVPSVRLVTFMGGVINSTINPDTGALSTAFSPTFSLAKNTSGSDSLTLSATANTQSGSVNAISNISTTKYITFTNSNSLPTAAAVTNAQSASPVAASNSNVITYGVNDPTRTSGNLNISYRNTNKLWNLTLVNTTLVYTSLPIPAAAPRTGTFSGDDEAGSYQATVIITYN